MSLNYELSKIKNWKDVCFADDKMTGDCNGVIWGTMSVDLGEITEKNLDEWLWRCAFLAVTGGPLATYHDKDGVEHNWPEKREDLAQFIGLSTNVSGMTRKQWVAKRMKIMSRDADAYVTRHFKQRDAA